MFLTLAGVSVYMDAFVHRRTYHPVITMFFPDPVLFVEEDDVRPLLWSEHEFSSRRERKQAAIFACFVAVALLLGLYVVFLGRTGCVRDGTCTESLLRR
jgi:hypothetical protein